MKRALGSQKPRDTRFLPGLHVRGRNVASPDHNLEILQVGAVISKMLTQLDDVARISHLDYHDPLILRGTSLRSSMRPARGQPERYSAWAVWRWLEGDAVHPIKIPGMIDSLAREKFSEYFKAFAQRSAPSGAIIKFVEGRSLPDVRVVPQSKPHDEPTV